MHTSEREILARTELQPSAKSTPCEDLSCDIDARTRKSLSPPSKKSQKPLLTLFEIGTTKASQTFSFKMLVQNLAKQQTIIRETSNWKRVRTTLPLSANQQG
ncbi:MAG: hypothetical protein EZS28_021579 [Streblomastix strix]|uniref:Uncharacterized protein n=1 Tax=Streblomastix strix TaxID=222440 RepID=A0A5J4VL05_9EUKA|nr:MAG: hypothetical protein EZS28_021579 [Streblomastix strix]